MLRKTVPLSLRISDRDAAFLASYELEGATTPSEKVRHLITEARERAEAKRPEENSAAAQHLLGPSKKRWESVETKTGRRSDLAAKLYDRAPQLFGRLMMAPHHERELAGFEGDLAREAARILEELLALEICGNLRTYKDGALRQELSQAKTLLERTLTDHRRGDA